ncbi:hypothetical protein Tco_0553325 [Tanacetum coccineum]
MRTRSQSREQRPHPPEEPQEPPVVLEPLRIEYPFQEDPPVEPMADTRTMAQLIQAPTEGYDSSDSTHLYSNPNTDPNRMPLTKAKGQIPQKDKIHKIESMIKRFRKRYSRVVCPNEAAIESNPGLMRN